MFHVAVACLLESYIHLVCHLLVHTVTPLPRFRFPSLHVPSYVILDDPLLIQPFIQLSHRLIGGIQSTW